jgi:hypothetical protein
MTIMDKIIALNIHNDIHAVISKSFKVLSVDSQSADNNGQNYCIEDH